MYVSGCGQASRQQKASYVDMLRATPLIVTRLRLDGGLGVGRENDGGSAATLVTSSRSGKGAPMGMGRRYGFQPWKRGLGWQSWHQVELVVFLLLLGGIWLRRALTALLKE